MADDTLQKVSDMASEVSRLANTDKSEKDKEEVMDEIGDLVEKMDDKLPE